MNLEKINKENFLQMPCVNIFICKTLKSTVLDSLCTVQHIPSTRTVTAGGACCTGHGTSNGVGTSMTGVVLGGVSVVRTGIARRALRAFCLPRAAQVA